jgi:serine/threonine protein kinase
MEYLPCPTLNEYAEIHKECISFLTKIHLASLVVHSLQILKNNSIVHMDIKPSNIMVGKKMIVKLFDFGESYHREVCDKSYKPAFSNPYGSPEVVDNVKM